MDSVNYFNLTAGLKHHNYLSTATLTEMLRYLNVTSPTVFESDEEERQSIMEHFLRLANSDYATLQRAYGKNGILKDSTAVSSSSYKGKRKLELNPGRVTKNVKEVAYIDLRKRLANVPEDALKRFLEQFETKSARRV